MDGSLDLSALRVYAMSSEEEKSSGLVRIIYMLYEMLDYVFSLDEQK